MQGKFNKIIKSFTKAVNKLAKLEAEAEVTRTNNQERIATLETENTDLAVLVSRVRLVKNNLEKLTGA